jgi:FMN-dependent NADH-azoreductase
MSKVLLITSSPRGEASHSSRIARTLADQLASGDPKSTVSVRDLFKEPLPHIGEHFVSALFAPPESHTPAQSAAAALSDRLIAELLAADVIVIASAMINFGISSTLKTYIDHILRKGVTFRYTEKGPEGLVKGKKAYIVRASGGVYSEGDSKTLNFQDPYLKLVLGFIGITDVETIHIEGIAYGPEATDKALTAAAERVATIPPHQAAAAAA